MGSSAARGEQTLEHTHAQTAQGNGHAEQHQNGAFQGGHSGIAGAGSDSAGDGSGDRSDMEKTVVTTEPTAVSRAVIAFSSFHTES